MKLNRSTRFKRSFKKLPPHIQEDFEAKIKLFVSNPFRPSLRTHKLSGNLSACYAFYLRDGYRVLFDFAKDDIVILVNIGSHDDYQKWTRG